MTEVGVREAYLKVESLKLDVCVAAIREVDETFPEMLKKAAIPVNKLLIDSATKPLGKARENLIGMVTTPLFIFVDDDIILPENWFTRIMQYWNDESGWLEGYALPLRPSWLAEWSKYRFQKAKPFYLRRDDRGYTLDTIVRTDLVRDWHSPDDLNLFEDKAICDHVKSKGYRCLRVPVECAHSTTYEYYSHLGEEVREMRKRFPKSAGLQFAVAHTIRGLDASWHLKSYPVAINSLRSGLEILRSYYF